MDLFAQLSFRAHIKAIANQQRPDRQFWIDQWTACMAVEVCKMGADAAQIDEPVNRPQQVILGV